MFDDELIRTDGSFDELRMIGVAAMTTQSERARWHQARMQQINGVQVVRGLGDGTRPDHEGTLLERARMLAEEVSSHTATERALAAFDRLLHRVEIGGATSPCEVAGFLAAVWNHRPLPLAVLRGVDESTADDMLAVLDGYRHGRLNLVEHVEGGPRRVVAALTGKTGSS